VSEKFLGCVIGLLIGAALFAAKVWIAIQLARWMGWL
jgi:hypothetical protein